MREKAQLTEFIGNSRHIKKEDIEKDEDWGSEEVV
jgi:hypothetical protein